MLQIANDKISNQLDYLMNKQNKYLILKSQYCLANYCLVALRKEDIQLIRKWRNDQMDILRQKKPLSVLEQKKYYDNIIQKTFSQKKPESILFSFLFNNICIGYGGFVHISWDLRRAELSFIVDTKRSKNKRVYNVDLSTFLTLIKQIAFSELNLNRIFTETYNIRPFHISVLEKSGFQLEGQLKEHMKISNVYVDSLIHGFLRSQFSN